MQLSMPDYLPSSEVCIVAPWVCSVHRAQFHKAVPTEFSALYGEGMDVVVSPDWITATWQAQTQSRGLSIVPDAPGNTCGSRS